FLSTTHQPLTSTLFPYTTLFRSDERTDVYSLAIVLYRLLSGTPPFKADSDYALMTAHLQQPPPPLAERVPELDRNTEAALIRARSEEHTSELQSPYDLVCRLLLE